MLLAYPSFDTSVVDPGLFLRSAVARRTLVYFGFKNYALKQAIHAIDNMRVAI